MKLSFLKLLCILSFAYSAHSTVYEAYAYNTSRETPIGTLDLSLLSDNIAQITNISTLDTARKHDALMLKSLGETKLLTKEAGSEFFEAVFRKTSTSELFKSKSKSKYKQKVWLEPLKDPRFSWLVKIKISEHISGDGIKQKQTTTDSMFLKKAAH